MNIRKNPMSTKVIDTLFKPYFPVTYFSPEATFTCF